MEECGLTEVVVVMVVVVVVGWWCKSWKIVTALLM